MRRVMWSKWASNLTFVALLGFVIVMVYWQQKLVTLEEDQQLLRTKLGHLAVQTKPKAEALGDEVVGNGNYPMQEIGDGGSVPNYAETAVILYNRIPKTGSTSFMGMAYDLCVKNNFHVIHLNTTKNSHVMSPADQMRFAQNVSTWMEKRPVIYHGHLGFIDFSSLGVPLRPIYINIIRDPLDRLVSYYYFLRYGDDFRPEVVRKKQGNTETFDECVLRQGNDCDPLHLWMQVPFFCGHHAACWEAGNSWALQQAKSNLAKSYLLVGTTESMETFIAVLEASLPRFFSGALKYFQDGGKSHLRKTYGKQVPNKDTVRAIRKSKIWQMEQDFYMFAKKNFNAVKKRTLATNGSALPQQFRYEKIRPK